MYTLQCDIRLWRITLLLAIGHCNSVHANEHGVSEVIRKVLGSGAGCEFVVHSSVAKHLPVIEFEIQPISITDKPQKMKIVSSNFGRCSVFVAGGHNIGENGITELWIKEALSVRSIERILILLENDKRGIPNNFNDIWNFDAYFVYRNESNATMKKCAFTATWFPVNDNGWKCVNEFLEKPLRVVYPYLAPWSYYAPGLVGADVTIMNWLSQKSGISMKFVLGGSYTTSVEMVFNGSADLMIGNPSMTLDRFKKVDYCMTNFQRILRIVTAMPKPVDSWFTFLYTFNRDIWITILIAVGAVGTTLMFTDTDHLIFGCKQSTFQNICLAYTPLVSESMPFHWILKANKPKKVLLFVWIPFALIISLSYRSNLKAMLVRKDFEKPVDIVQDVLDKDMELLSPRGIFMTEMLRTSPNKLYRRMYQKLYIEKSGGYPYDGASIPDWVRDSLYAGTGFFLTTDSFVRGKEYKLRRGTQIVSATNACYIVPKMSPLSKVIDEYMFRILESGLFHQTKDRHLAAPRTLDKDLRLSKDEPIIFSQMQPVMILMLIGLSLSALCFIIEITKPLETTLDDLINSL